MKAKVIKVKVGKKRKSFRVKDVVIYV